MTSPTAVGPATGSRNCKVRLKHVGFFTKVCGAWKRSIDASLTCFTWGRSLQAFGALPGETKDSAVAVQAPQALRVPQKVRGLGRPRFTAKEASGFLAVQSGAKVEDTHTDTRNFLR